MSRYQLGRLAFFAGHPFNRLEDAEWQRGWVAAEELFDQVAVGLFSKS